MKDIKIHPAAECVRLMDPEELASLAASIEANGLRDPIVLGRINGAANEMLVDGRNRLRACEIAGVEPQFETKDFEDDEAIKAYIADKSEHRNLTKGQQAMRLALLYPDSHKGKRTEGSARTLSESNKVSSARISQARTILVFSRELALAVRDGTKKLDQALDEVKAARDALNSEEWMIGRLRKEAPDLADLVAEERMNAREAIAALNKRIEDYEQERRTATFLLHQALIGLNPRTKTPEQWADEMLDLVDEKFWPNNVAAELTAKCIQACATALNVLARKWEEKHGD